MPEILGETIDVRLRIRQRKTEEKTITRENLVKIQQFILNQGKRETYCNIYSDNPAYQTKSYRNLTIRKADGGKNQYRTVEFLDKHYVYVTANWPTDDLDVQQIRKFVEDAMKELLDEIEKKEPNKPDGTGHCGLASRGTAFALPMILDQFAGQADHVHGPDRYHPLPAVAAVGGLSYGRELVTLCRSCYSIATYEETVGGG